MNIFPNFIYSKLVKQTWYYSNIFNEFQINLYYINYSEYIPVYVAPTKFTTYTVICLAQRLPFAYSLFIRVDAVERCDLDHDKNSEIIISPRVEHIAKRCGTLSWNAYWCQACDNRPFSLLSLMPQAWQ